MQKNIKCFNINKTVNFIAEVIMKNKITGKITGMVVQKQIYTDENIYKGIKVSKYGGATKDIEVVLADENVQELLKLIQKNNKK